MAATERINIRTTEHAKAIIEQASAIAGVSVSNFIVQQAYDKAASMIEMHKRITSNTPTEITLLDAAMAYNGVDTSDIELETAPKLPSKNRFVEFD